MSEHVPQFAEVTFEYARKKGALAGPYSRSLEVEMPIENLQDSQEAHMRFGLSIVQGPERAIAVATEHPVLVLPSPAPLQA